MIVLTMEKIEALETVLEANEDAAWFNSSILTKDVFDPQKGNRISSDARQERSCNGQRF